MSKNSININQLIDNATGPDVPRRLLQWSADCVAHVLHIYERVGRSSAPRAATIAARQFARGEISATEFDRLRAIVAELRNSRRTDQCDGSQKVLDAIGALIPKPRPIFWRPSTSADFACTAMSLAAGHRYYEETIGTPWFYNDDHKQAREDRARATEEEWQYDRLRQWLKGDEPADWPLPGLPAKPTATPNHVFLRANLLLIGTLVCFTVLWIA